MTRIRAFISIGIVIAVIAWWYVGVERSGEEKLNIILVSIDSLRTDHMSTYGYGRETTPNIDAWARDKIVFDNYFSTSYLTPVAEMSVHTGRYPFGNGMVSFTTPLRGDVETLAEILKKNGWQTAAFGSSPEFQWFASVRAGFSRGFEMFPRKLSGVETARNGELPARTHNPVEEAVAWLKDGRDTTKPFFLWIPIGSVHWPYGQDFPNVFSDASYTGFLKTEPSEWKTYSRIYNGKRYSASTTLEQVKGRTVVNFVTSVPPKVVGEVSPEDMAYLTGRYDDGILATDAMLGALFTSLKALRLQGRTIVVIQSEHGEGLGERGYISHYDITDIETHVPLILSIPGVPGRREESLISGVDVLPTVLSALQIPSPRVDGVTFLPYLKGVETTPPREEVFIVRTPLWESVLLYSFGDLGREFVRQDATAHNADVAIRTDTWKLIHRGTRDVQRRYSWWGWLTSTPVTLPQYELYNIQEDPDEEHNLSTDQSVTSMEVIQGLKDKLDGWEKSMRQALPQHVSPQVIQEYF